MAFKPTITEELREYRHSDGALLSYKLIQSTRRKNSMTMRMGRELLEVLVPKRTAVRTVELFIAMRWPLITEWLQARSVRRDSAQAAQHRALSEGRIPYFGRELLLIVGEGRGADQLGSETLLLRTPKKSITEAELLELVQKWYKKQARAIFTKALEDTLRRLGLTGKYQLTLRISSARTRWGSCSSRGTVALNWRLLFYDRKFLDYVLCHELAHLKEMNHSARFWQVVESYYPDYRSVRRELKQIQLDSSLFG